MTEQWKPVPHSPLCEGARLSDCECLSWCNGTRWSGYGERVGDCAAVWALCEWFGKMREPLMPDDYIAVPVAAWQEMVDEFEKTKPTEPTFMHSPASLSLLNRQFPAFRCVGDE